MMNSKGKTFKTLNETFDISVEPIDTEIEEIKPLKTIKTYDDLETDYEYVRSTMTNIISKGSEALDNILEVAQESDSARAYEVVGQLLDKISTCADKLIEMHKKIKDIKDEDTSSPAMINNNAIFVGTTSEAIKMIRDKIKTIDLEEESPK